MKKFGLKVLDVIADITCLVEVSFGALTDKIDEVLLDKGFYDEEDDVDGQ